MKCVFRNNRITAITAVVPKDELRFDDEYPNYKLTEERARKLKKMMGLDRHRVVPESVTTGDLCYFGVRHLLDRGVLGKDDIGALVFASQTPDYFLPPTSNVIQGRLGLDKDVFCLDMNQGCAGFIVGLMQAFMLLELPEMKKVVVMCGDTGSRHATRRNRASWPLVGDAGAVAIVERTGEDATVFMNIKNDGSRHKALIIPAGAYRRMPSLETLAVVEVEEGIERSQQHMHMDGAAVFTFTLEDVPPLIDEILAFSGSTRETIDYFLFHQPNQFILKQMGNKMKIPPEKLPSNIVGVFGNVSSATIPLDIAFNCGATLLKGALRVCLSGFGVGLTWSSMVMNLGPLTECSVIEYSDCGE